jgi:hypothetical protein
LTKSVECAVGRCRCGSLFVSIRVYLRVRTANATTKQLPSPVPGTGVARTAQRTDRQMRAKQADFMHKDRIISAATTFARAVARPAKDRAPALFVAPVARESEQDFWGWLSGRARGEDVFGPRGECPSVRSSHPPPLGVHRRDTPTPSF